MVKENTFQGEGLLRFLDRPEEQYMTRSADIELLEVPELRPQDSILFRVNEITYEDEAPWKEALENVLSAARIPGVHLVYLLLGSRTGVEFYYGLSRDYSVDLDSKLTIAEIGQSVLKDSMAGNFRGSDVAEVGAEKKDPVLQKIRGMRYVARIEGVAGSVKDDERFQSVDRLVDIMQGENFCLLVVAKALELGNISEIEHDIHAAYDRLAPVWKHTWQEGGSEGTSKTEETGGGTSTNTGTSWSVSREYQSRCVQEWLSYCDEVILPRLDYGKGKGIFTSAFYGMAASASALIKLENTVISLYSGKKGNRVPLRAFPLEKEDPQRRAAYQLQLPLGRFRNQETGLAARAFLSQPVSGRFPVGNWITTNELAMIAGLPRKEVVGLRLRGEVEFGLNCRVPEEEGRIELGNLVQNGKMMNIPIYLDKASIDKHLFITGVTGSGKTTTCQKILVRSGLPFLVIEPAKTEYRIMKNNRACQDLLVFTLGDDNAAPFRLNPFEFLPDESITSHVDMIKASMEAAFDMEAAIPQLIERTIYKCYEDCGWDIDTGKNRLYQDRAFDPGVYAFPRLSDFLDKISAVVQEQGFDDRLQKDYIGSIRARLQSLKLGAKGAMLDTYRSIDWDSLLDKQVVFELESVRSSGEKSFIMGLILTAFNEAVRERYLKDKRPHPHILLVEEAHRLLSKYTPGDSKNKKYGVEIFSDMLAEIRKYGECLIIADQIPNKMAEDVLKNTNTKIVHRVFAQDDKEAIGNTMALTEEQKQFLSNLGTGRAVLFSDTTGLAMQVQISRDTDTASAPLSDPELRERAFRYYWQECKHKIFLPLRDPFSLPDQVCGRALDFIRADIPMRIYRNYRTDSKYTAAYAQELKEVLERGLTSQEDLANWIMTHDDSNSGAEGTELYGAILRFIQTYPLGQNAVDEGEFGRYF